MLTVLIPELLRCLRITLLHRDGRFANLSAHYIITTAILVTVMSLGVADAIHVQGEYYDELRRGAFRDRQDLVVRAVRQLWVPIFCTSVTDMASFVSFFITVAMPPFQWFGLFTAVGIGATLAASFSILPAGLVLADPSRAMRYK